MYKATVMKPLVVRLEFLQVHFQLVIYTESSLVGHEPLGKPPDGVSMGLRLRLASTHGALDADVP